MSLLAIGQFGAERGFDAAGELDTLAVLGSRTRHSLSPGFPHQLQLAITLFKSSRRTLHSTAFVIKIEPA